MLLEQSLNWAAYFYDQWNLKVCQGGGFEVIRSFLLKQALLTVLQKLCCLGDIFCFTPMSDQDRISSYNIKQASNENKEKYQLGDYKLIQNQILQTNILRTVWQSIRRIASEIMGVKRLRLLRAQFGWARVKLCFLK